MGQRFRRNRSVRSAADRIPGHETDRVRRCFSRNPASACRAAVPRLDGPHPGAPRLPLPAAGHRQRARMGSHLRLRLRSDMGWRSACTKRAIARARRLPRSRAIRRHALRLRDRHVPSHVPVSHGAGMEPRGNRTHEPAQGRHRAAHRRHRDRLAALPVHHELADDAAGARALPEGRADLPRVSRRRERGRRYRTRDSQSRRRPRPHGAGARVEGPPRRVHAALQLRRPVRRARRAGSAIISWAGVPTAPRPTRST